MSNNDDFGSDDFDLEGFDDDFGDLNKDKGTLGDLWRNNAFVKIGVILAVLAFIVLLFIIFGGEKEQQTRSKVRGGSDVTETPGQEEVSENIRAAIEDVNTQRLEDALRNQTSTVPMPVNASKGQIPFELNKPEEEDPLERWRRLQEEKVDRAVKDPPPPPEPEAPPPDTKTPAIQALSEAMSQQMESILGNQGLKGANVKNVADLAYLEGVQKKQDDLIEAAREKREQELELSAEQGELDDDAILLPAGTIEYAQLITEANTDVPGPILAQIMTGPFKGARLIGSFSETYNYLTLNFNTIVLDGVDYSVSAVALDPDTTLPGLATDINRRYFTRIVLPVAAEFIAGYANALSESGNTTITVNGTGTTQSTTNNDLDSDQEVASGIATAGQELSSIINEIKNNYPQLIRVRAGTPMGILFTAAVTNEQDEEVGGPYQQLQDFQLRDNGTNNGQPAQGQTNRNNRN